MVPGGVEQIVHSVPVEQDSADDHAVEDVMGSSNPIEATREPTLRHLQGVERGSNEVNEDTL